MSWECRTLGNLRCACLAGPKFKWSEREGYSGKYYHKCYFFAGKNILNAEFPEQKISSQGTNTVLLLDRISSHGINTVLLLDSVKNHMTYLQQRIRSPGWC